MHFAICFWGLVRSLRFTIDSIETHCLQPITRLGHTYDIFLHTYNFTGNYSSIRNDEPPGVLNFTDWKLLNPYYMKMEDQDELDKSLDYSLYASLGVDPWNNDYASHQNHIRALYSLHHLASQIEHLHNSNIKNYDGVIYLRPDVLYLNDIPILLFKQYTNALIVPDFHRSCSSGQYNDRMAMGDVKSAIIYGKNMLNIYCV